MTTPSPSPFPQVETTSASSGRGGAVACALFMCVDDLQYPAAPFSNNNAHHFRHTTRRAALARKGGGRGVLHHPDEEDDEESPAKYVEERVIMARQRRAKYLQAKAKALVAQADHRLKVEEVENKRSDLAAEKISTKLECAARRRELRQQERNAAHEMAERVRSTRLLQARSRRLSALVTYAANVAPVLDVFRGLGLCLQGARTSTAVEQILMQDPLAPCSACTPAGGPPRQSLCPSSKKRHPRMLVVLSETFLKGTGELRQMLHANRVRRCTEQDHAQAEGTGIHHHDSDEAPTPAKDTPTSPTKDLIGLPHFLPLAFHEACGSSASKTDEAKLYAARNVVLQLEEIQAVSSCISVASGLPQFTPTPEEGAVVEDANPTVFDAELHVQCEHLRHTLSRFGKAWVQFCKTMRAGQEESQTDAAKQRMRQQMLSSYVQLQVSMNSRTADVQRRQELIDNATEAQAAALKNREQRVARGREELTMAMAMEMRDLRRMIERAGLLAELEDQLAQIQCPFHSSSASSIPTATTTFTKALVSASSIRALPEVSTVKTVPFASDGGSTSSASASCGLSSSSPGQGSSIHQGGVGHDPCIPHVNSADWCGGDLCLSETDYTPQRQRGVKSAITTGTNTTGAADVRKKISTGSHSSAGFRAQLAADRQRMRAQRKVDKAAEDPLIAGNDGDADEA